MPVLDAIGPIFRLSSLTSFDVVTLLALVPFALIAGSFCTALVYRIPQGIPWAFGNFKGEDTQVISSKNSRCPACGTVLTARDLVPVFSWLLLRGKCRHCGAPIPPRYLYIELSMLGMFVLTWLFFGLSWEVALLYIALPFLLALFVIDLDHMILPDQLNAILFVIGVLQMAVLVMLGQGDAGALALHFILGALIFAGFSYLLRLVMSKLLKKEAMGLGDVKFFAVAGGWLGVMALPEFLMLAGVLGIIFGLYWKLILKQDMFPFGPALIMSFFVLLLLPPSFLPF